MTSSPLFPPIVESQRLLARATGLIPALTQTLAKGPTQHVQGVAPIYLRRGQGCRVWDVDGNCFIDYTMGVGPLSLGYAYPAVDEAIRRQLADGITFSLMHPLEVELAERLRDILPNAEMVRYAKTGAEATSAAVRLARAYTGREKVLCCGYHGWHDWYISVLGRSAGVPRAVQDLVHTFAYNDIASLRRAIDHDTACVILEPMTFEFPKPGFLQEVQAVCREHGALLIFDEMWTGFRLALGGAQAYFGVTADLACYSKAIANGMPLAVLAGRAEVMRLLEADVFFFSTFGGEALSLAAALATLDEMERHDVPAALARRGAMLQEGLGAIAAELGLDGAVRCVGHPSRTMLAFDARAGDPLLMKSLVQQELIRRGILWSGFHNLSFSHGEAEIEETLAAYREALAELRDALDAGDLAGRLRGQPVQPVFRRTGDFDTKPVRAGDNGRQPAQPAR
ncbi:MAG: aminotransferase class III-fold pyridoxal phosphate-dependent enzyme [Caldilineales bacterium]|nr:aminotransferase class III-fold pyridoxal phosphate-dependent enzyme [Caldilineales bacterium]MDW8319079.1 aminotransferase class III-fold pyridoxal phosphate-dependent enzyme [Anaerolineae bacterium]